MWDIFCLCISWTWQVLWSRTTLWQILYFKILFASCTVINRLLFDEVPSHVCYNVLLFNRCSWYCCYNRFNSTPTFWWFFHLSFSLKKASEPLRSFWSKVWHAMYQSKLSVSWMQWNHLFQNLTSFQIQNGRKTLLVVPLVAKDETNPNKYSVSILKVEN